MAQVKVVMTGQEHLDAMDDNVASCKGDRHDFPKLRVGPLPPGVTARPTSRQGVSQLTFTCPDCGTKRTKTTRRGGIVETAKYDYDYPPGYLAPRGSGLTKADYAANLGKRVAPFIREAASRPPVFDSTDTFTGGPS
jgi:hypothetical protein